MIYRKYKLEKKYYSNLSKEDIAILKILESAVKDIAKVYELQIKEGFYPKGMSKEVLEKENEVDPDLLSPFTCITLENGLLKVIPYHIHFAKFLKPIAKKIEKAANISTNKSFKAYLQARAKSLIDGSYKRADILWLNIKDTKIDFNIGPFEKYLDKLFFVKSAFQGHVGIIDEDATKQAIIYKETLYSSTKIGFSKFHSTDIPQKGVQIFYEETPVTAGYISYALTTGQHFPADVDIMQQYGSKIIIYYSPLRSKFDKLYYPIFKACFEKTFASKYSRELLFEATSLCGLLAHLGRQLHQFRGARERLKEFYGQIDAANGFASGIEHSKHLVVKGLISQDQLEAIIIVHILWMVADWIRYKQLNIKESHTIGNSILLNSYLSSGALRESEGISWPNFSRIFFEIETMAYKLTYLLQNGSYKEAEKFIKENANLKSFERLSKTLSNINTQI